MHAYQTRTVCDREWRQDWSRGGTLKAPRGVMVRLSAFLASLVSLHAHAGGPGDVAAWIRAAGSRPEAVERVRPQNLRLLRDDTETTDAHNTNARNGFVALN